MILNGKVASAELCAPLSDVCIRRFDKQGQDIGKIFSDDNGCWQFDVLNPDDQIQFDKEGFTSKTVTAEHLTELIRLLENRIVGYLDKLWMLPGESLPVYVHSVENYSASLFRHGDQKELVQDLGQFPSSIQEIPNRTFVENGLSWKESFNLQIKKNTKPGLYSLFLKPEKGESFAIPLIIQTLPEKYGQDSKLLVLASNTTWQSYNLWGGRSRYRNFEDAVSQDFKKEYLPWIKSLILKTAELIPLRLRLKLKKWMGKAPPAWMFKRLSMKRPYTNCFLEQDSPDLPFTNHLAAGEWRVLAWLERQHIPYDFVPGQVLHHNPELLQNYQGILLNTHCEYWSKEMYESLKFHHQEKGLWIFNISGNSIYRQIEFEEDGSTRCISLHFENSCSDETEVIGVRFTEDDYGTAAPYKIITSNHWIFDGLDLSKDHIFGRDTLNCWTEKTYDRYDPGRPGLASGLKGIGGSGWETDKLSKTASTEFVRIARGMNKHGGADMVIREPQENRGGVFSVSSITFGGTLLVDKLSSGLLRNVIHKIFT